MLFSLIVPVYNRPDEIADLFASLDGQDCSDFEVVIVEDGSTIPCRPETEQSAHSFPVKYFFKENEGRSIARNYGIERAEGEWLVFVDSDCILPPDYFSNLKAEIVAHPEVDFFGGPDAAHPSFTTTQKAINFAMTSLFTTGGIRGGKVSMEKFVPRTFNMGFRRQLYPEVGGFREMFSEDIDMSTRLRNHGHPPMLFRKVKVFHKRRGNLRKFWRQVHVFGMSRITLQLLYPGSMKLVHWMPAAFTVGAIVLIALSFWNPWFLLPLGIYVCVLFLGALWEEHNIKVALKAIAASMVQLLGYGTGFLRAYTWKILLRHGRDEAQEVALRKGK